MNYPKRLNRQQASRYLYEVRGIQRAPTTLAKLACTGGGPPYQLDGRRPLYTPEELDGWVIERLSKPVRLTSEADAARRAPGEGNGGASNSTETVEDT